MSCWCGLPADYAECCGRFHAGSANAPTAELLMRSRYSAFAVGDADYLLATWAPVTRPAALDLDRRDGWTGLEIHGTTGGGLFDDTGTVHFTARYVRRRRPGSQTENSFFRRIDGRWFYVGVAP